MIARRSLPCTYFERDVKGAVGAAQVEDLRDVGMRQLHGDLGFIHEHRDELFVLRDARQDALDGDQALEALHASGLGPEHFRHAANVDAIE